VTTLTKEQLDNILKNRAVFSKMSLKDRLALRQTFMEGVNLNIPVIRPSDSDKAELRENVRTIDELNLREQLDSRKLRGVNQK
jgi:hypothetical protein